MRDISTLVILVLELFLKLADYIIDVGTDGGDKGGKIVFKGTPKEMVEHGNTITAEYLKNEVL